MKIVLCGIDKDDKFIDYLSSKGNVISNVVSNDTTFVRDYQ